MKPDCYKCKHRGDLAWDTHSECLHPDRFKKDLGIKGVPKGIDGGWFFWPFNFDPVWLKECKGYET